MPGSTFPEGSRGRFDRMSDSTGRTHPALQRDITTWQVAMDSLLTLLTALDETDWERPTDLPGWRVRDVVAHLAHLESELAGHEQPHVDVPPAAHVRSEMGVFTESGVLARADRSPTELIDEITASARDRLAALETTPITDPTATSSGFGAVMGWSWATLLSNRVLDVWMHEQDVRRAVGRPGGLDTPAAAHAATMMAAALPIVFAKRAGAPAGATLVLDATGPGGRVLSVEVGSDGRARLLDAEPADPTVHVTMSLADWLVLAGGRRTPDAVSVQVEGDEDLGRRVLESLAVTP